MMTLHFSCSRTVIYDYYRLASLTIEEKHVVWIISSIDQRERKTGSRRVISKLVIELVKLIVTK